MKKEQNTSRYYSEIMNLLDAGEIKSLVKKWEILADNIGEARPDMPILLPDYILLSPPGAGKSTVFELLSGYLYDRGLMHFQGDRRVVEFTLEYCSPDQTFDELSRLSQSIRAAAGFHNKFTGILSLDISLWAAHMDEYYMTLLLQYLTDNTNDWLIFLVLDTTERELIDHAETVISRHLRVNRLKLPYPKAPAMTAYILRQIRDYGFECDESAEALLRSTITLLHGKKYFSGYKTLGLFTKEILYTIYSGKRGLPPVLTAEMLERFSPEGEFTLQMIENMPQKRKIGFKPV